MIVDFARNIYLGSGLPIELWPEFTDQAVRILNRLPIQRGQWTSPYEFVFHTKADLSLFKEVGSKAYVLIQAKKREKLTLHKLQSKAIEGWLVGMQASNIYRVWIPQIDRVIVSRDVRVDEAIKYTPNTAENMISIGSRKIITILEQDIDEQEIEELMREKQEEHQIDIVDENDITLPVKNIKEGLPTPPLLDKAVN